MTVMKLTSPKDVCRSAAVSTTFQSAADLDDVWQSFLPIDLSSILYRGEIDVEQLPVSKKELYLHFCRNWILLDGGTKSFRLDLWNGAKIIQLHKQNSSIKNPIETPIKIHEAIHLKDLSPKRNYGAYMIFTGKPYTQVLRIIQCVYGSSSGFGSPIYAMDIIHQESQKREDGWREIKLEEFHTNVGGDRAVHFIINNRYTINPYNDLIFKGIEVRPVC
ncbi:putative F-box protein PP2-B2 [Carex rostrata]